MFFDHPLISERYFFPRKDHPENFYQIDCNDAVLACYRVEKYPDANTLIHFHGNGEVVSDYLPEFCEAILSMKVNVLFVEYRGYGASTGRPSLQKMLGDTSCIYQALQLPEERLFVFGRSIGSIYAIEFAARYPKIAGLVLESGIADPFERVLLRVTPEEVGASKEAFSKEAKQFFNHQQKLEAYHNPLLVLHAAQDHLVDVSHAKRNFEWVTSEDKFLTIFPKGDHNTISFANWNEYQRLLQEFFQKFSMEKTEG